MKIEPLSKFNSNYLDGLKFCAEIYELFEAIRADPDGVSRLRMKKTKIEKKLLEELLPICKYIQTKYRTGRYISVCWVDGNQKYDAELRQSGFYIEQGYFPALSYLEVTCAMHPNEYLSRERLEKVGFMYGLDGLSRLKNGSIESESVCHLDRDFVASDAGFILNEVRKKSENNYPLGPTLIVQSTLSTIYTSDEWNTLISFVKNKLPINSFEEIFIYDSVLEYTYSFWKIQNI